MDTGSSIMTMVASYGMQVLGAIAILVIGSMAAKWVSKTVYKAMKKSPKSDETLNRFLSSLVRYAVLAFTGMAVLSQFGIQTASLVAVFGAMGLAIGLAMQGTLGHVASGVMLLIFRPFKIGDFIEVGGTAGTVENIGLFTTEMNTPDNVRIIMPNGQVWDTSVKNFSINNKRRMDIVMGIGYNDSIDTAMKTMGDVMKADSRIHTDPAPIMAVTELADSSVNITVRAWCDSGDFWMLQADLKKAWKEAFDAKGISIPYPQQDLHIIEGGASALTQKAS